MNLKKIRNTHLGIFLVRLSLAIVFIYHGVDKIQNMDGVVGFFGSLGLPPVFAYLVTASELLGGLAMLLGVATACAGLLLAAVMAGAIYLVKFSKGFAGGGYELDLTLLLISLAIVFLGPGCYTISCLFGKKCDARESHQ